MNRETAAGSSRGPRPSGVNVSPERVTVKERGHLRVAAGKQDAPSRGAVGSTARSPDTGGAGGLRAVSPTQTYMEKGQSR